SDQRYVECSSSKIIHKDILRLRQVDLVCDCGGRWLGNHIEHVKPRDRASALCCLDFRDAKICWTCDHDVLDLIASDGGSIVHKFPQNIGGNLFWPVGAAVD